jgi:adenosine deaminase
MHLDEIRALPKVLLHDHLDGGLRPETVIDLAQACGYDRLPTLDPVELGQWFVEAADSGSLVRYLETFEHTVSVCQTEDALRRVAAECVEDLAADGVVYAEVRFAPELFTAGGLTMGQAVEAVLDGFDTEDDIVVNASAVRDAAVGSRGRGRRSGGGLPRGRRGGYGHRRSGDRLPRLAVR